MSHFYAMLFRMKYINRWSLMRNMRTETLSEHTLEVGFIAHALAVLSKERLGKPIDTEAVLLCALFHDTPEIITGDLPTPIKYYNRQINEAYGQIETKAQEKLIDLLPTDLQEEYKAVFAPTPEVKQLVKAADKIQALLKCTDEIACGNREFLVAKASTLQSIQKMQCPAAELFLEEYLPSFSLALDEQK